MLQEDVVRYFELLRRVVLLRRVPVLRVPVLRLRDEVLRPVEPLLDRADARPPRAPAARTLIRPPVFVREPVLRLRVPVERACDVVLRLRDVVPVARRRAVVRPPFAAAARDGARRVVVLRLVPVVRRVPVERACDVVLRLRDVVPVARRRAVVRPPFAAAARDGARRVPVERLRVPDVLRERDVPEVERRVVVPVLRRGRAARTFSTASSGFSAGSDSCSAIGLCSWLGRSEVLLNG
jgi:hypothetical protein